MKAWLRWTRCLLVAVAVALLGLSALGFTNGGSTELLKTLGSFAAAGVGLYLQGRALHWKQQQQEQQAIRQAIHDHEERCPGLAEIRESLGRIEEKLRRPNGRQQNT